MRYGAILADPPWAFATWSNKGKGRSADRHYATLSDAQLARLPVHTIAAANSVLFLWATWPLMPVALHICNAWGFDYKTCAFSWLKVTSEGNPVIGNGYWTRANTEFCLLATRGKPKRLNADVRQTIIAPRREHSRKPDCVYGRIERLVDGPYIELFARKRQPGWDSWGKEVNKFK